MLENGPGNRIEGPCICSSYAERHPQTGEILSERVTFYFAVLCTVLGNRMYLRKILVALVRLSCHNLV